MKRLRLVVAILAATPWIASIPSVPPFVRSLIGRVFVPMCHHAVARTLVFGDSPMCVCSRCAGLYAGLAVGFLCGAPGLPARLFSPLFLGALVATAMDVVTQDVGLHPPWHAVRLVTGAALGWTASAWMAYRFTATLSRAALLASRNAT